MSSTATAILDSRPSTADLDQLLGNSYFPTINFFTVEKITNNNLGIENIVSEQIRHKYYEARKEWIELVGEKRFNALPLRKREFLIRTAGIFDLGERVDISKVYNYGIY